MFKQFCTRNTWSFPFPYIWKFLISTPTELSDTMLNNLRGKGATVKTGSPKLKVALIFQINSPNFHILHKEFWGILGICKLVASF